MKYKLLTFMLLAILASCKGQNNDFLNEKSSILKNQSENLIQFARIANIIDSDDESYWAYGYADSILSAINISGKNYFKDLSKINSAYTYVFYGMSYTKTILAISRGDKYSLEELNRTINQPLNNDIADYYSLTKNELSAIYCFINFYKVSRMTRYEDMYALFQKKSMKVEDIFRKYQSEKAYRILSLDNKKLFFMIFSGLIIDIYSINNQNIEESVYTNYMLNIAKLGEEMDKLPSNYESILKLSDKVYFDYILKSSEVQKSMLNLLINEIKILKQKNE